MKCIDSKTSMFDRSPDWFKSQILTAADDLFDVASDAMATISASHPPFRVDLLEQSVIAAVLTHLQIRKSGGGRAADNLNDTRPRATIKPGQEKFGAETFILSVKTPEGRENRWGPFHSHSEALEAAHEMGMRVTPGSPE